MKSLLIALVLVAVCAEEMLVTREYTDYLKRHVDWEVVDYEENIFRGWTTEEAKKLLNQVELVDDGQYYPTAEVDNNLPSELSWMGASCIHSVRNQGNCGSCWAFAVAGMISDRCCLQVKDYGWLSPQELVSCDKKRDQGCRGGWPVWAVVDYVVPKNGLVHEACFPYVASDKSCPSTCADGKQWTTSHVCICKGVTICNSIEKLKTCLKTGTVAVSFEVCNSFFNYRSGIYKCDCGSNIAGLHAVDAIGYSDTPSCHLTVRNSWGTSWGNKGYFDIACDTCGIYGKYPYGNVMCETFS